MRPTRWIALAAFCTAGSLARAVAAGGYTDDASFVLTGGRLHDSAVPGGDEFTLRGVLLPVPGAAPTAIDPRAADFTVRVWRTPDDASGFFIAIAEADSGWTYADGVHHWSTPPGSLPRVTVRYAPANGDVRVSASGLDFLAFTGDVGAELAVAVAGLDAHAPWRAARGGRYTYRRPRARVLRTNGRSVRGTATPGGDECLFTLRLSRPDVYDVAVVSDADDDGDASSDLTARLFGPGSIGRRVSTQPSLPAADDYDPTTPTFRVFSEGGTYRLAVANDGGLPGGGFTVRVRSYGARPLRVGARPRSVAVPVDPDGVHGTWFHFVTPTEGRYTIQLAGALGPGAETSLVGAPRPGRADAEPVDWSFACDGSGASSLTFDLAASRRHFFVIRDQGPAAGRVAIRVGHAEPPLVRNVVVDGGSASVSFAPCVSGWKFRFDVTATAFYALEYTVPAGAWNTYLHLHRPDGSEGLLGPARTGHGVDMLELTPGTYEVDMVGAGFQSADEFQLSVTTSSP